MSAFTTPLNLSSLSPVSGVRLSGTVANERAGWSVASAGDVNGDGIDDVIVGGFIDGVSGTVSPGSAYVVFGRAAGWGDLDLGNLGTGGYRINGLAGVAAGNQLAIPVSGAGDVNGDGFDDLVVGAALAGNNGRFNSGSTSIIYGKATGFSTIDVSTTSGSRIDGGNSGDFSGRTVAAAGDFNGDGFGDVVIGGQDFNSNGVGGFRGSAFVVFGGRGVIPSQDLANNGSPAFRMNGAQGDNIGALVAAAGDINGDGLADIVTSGSLADANSRVDSGTSVVVFGRSSGFGTLNLQNLGSAGFRIQGAAAGDLSGSALASAGDVNGDGFTDLLVGASSADNRGRIDSGSAYLIFGHAGGFGELDLANLGNAGIRIDGAAAGDLLGSSLSGAGDVNGDGYADIVLGAPGADANSRTDSGSAWLVLGKASGFAGIDLANPGTGVFRFDGAATLDRLGISVAGAGDPDGDGFSDLLLGAPTADPLGRTDAGIANLLFSQSQGPAVYRGTTLADSLRGTENADVINGFGGHDRLLGRDGNDTISGGLGNDTIDGGNGIDLAQFSGAQSAYRFGQRAGTTIVAGPDGVDVLTNVENLQFGADAPVALSGIPGVENLFLSVSLGVSAFRLPDIYSGPVTRLNYQFLGSADGDVALGTGRNDFFNLLGGDDAVDAGAGDDVVDGGIGSNFLTGGVGRDDFFLDGRGNTTTWSTITDWQAGETLSVFGWRPGVSRVLWLDNDGTAGFKGVTMHADLDGNGQIETSVTWAGLNRGQLPTPQEFSDVLWFT